MKKNKLAAYIYWGMSALFLLIAVLASEQVILHLIFSAVWFIGGVVFWKREK